MIKIIIDEYNLNSDASFPSKPILPVMPRKYLGSSAALYKTPLSLLNYEQMNNLEAAPECTT